MAKIQTQFTNSDFLPALHPAFHFSTIQYFMAKRLHQELVKILTLFPENVFEVDSACLMQAEWEDFDRRNKIFTGLDDSFYGQPAPVKAGRFDPDIYGQRPALSVGAVRLRVSGPATVGRVFQAVSNAAKARTIALGEVGLVSGGGYSGSVLHLANRKDLIYSSEFVMRYFREQPWLWVSENGGLTIRRHIRML